MFTPCKALLLGGICLTLSSASAIASSVTLNGVIRDFSSSHANFEGAIDGLRTGVVQQVLDVDGKPVLNGIPGGSYTTQQDFAQWYRNVAGVNQAKAFSIDLDEDASSGLYSFSDSNFFPIDNALGGNEGRSHNYHFTVELFGKLAFTDDNQIFSFSGDDDLWVFLDDKLVLDIGGVHTPITKSFTGQDLADAGFNSNQNYDLKIFFAERHTTQSKFAITTNFVPTSVAPPPVPLPATLPLLAVAVGGLGALVRRRRTRA